MKSLLALARMGLIHFLPPCEVVAQRLSDSLDRRLPLRERIGVKLHLLICVFCTWYGRQILFVHDAFRRYAELIEKGDALPDVRLSEEAKARIKKALQESDGA